MKKILIFTAGFGEGHNSAARNIRDALEQMAPDEVQVEIVDLFDTCYGKVNDFFRRTYISAINKTPRLWSHLYSLLDQSDWSSTRIPALSRMREALETLLQDVQPDVVVSVYPVYNHLLRDIHAGGRPRHYTLITVITDSITINSFWHKGESDWYLVSNEWTAQSLFRAGVPEEKIRDMGFPVTPDFLDNTGVIPPCDPVDGSRKKIFYLLNSGRKKAAKIIKRILEHPDVELTIAAGRDPKVKAAVGEMIRDHRDRVTLLGWTSQVPRLLMSHHLLISKAGGATTQEAVAGCCPMIVSQVVPGQEEGNAHLIGKINGGAVTEKPSEIGYWIERAFADDGRLWKLWRRNLEKASRPRAALDIAEFILEEARPRIAIPSRIITSFHPASRREVTGKRMLLCDFHMHTRYSDGKLSLTDLVDFYGSRHFDCICVTDHIADSRRLLGKISRISGLVISPDQLDEYYTALRKERDRAWKKYGMIVMTGLEFNKDGMTRHSSAHLLGLDLQNPIDPNLSIEETIHAIHLQEGLAVAAHPHLFKSPWGKNTLYLWENQEIYGPLLDAWEIANRDDIFNPVGLKKLPLIANSDFHKPAHIHSWKTILHCEKDPEAIKECIRRNESVSISLYRSPQVSSPPSIVLDTLPENHISEVPVLYSKSV